MSRGLRLHNKCNGFPFIALPERSVGSKHSHLKLLTKVYGSAFLAGASSTVNFPLSNLFGQLPTLFCSRSLVQ